MALPRLAGESTLTVTGGLESAGYIAMTEDALRLSGIRLQKDARTYTVPGGQTAQLPAQCRLVKRCVFPVHGCALTRGRHGHGTGCGVVSGGSRGAGDPAPLRRGRARAAGCRHRTARRAARHPDRRCAHPGSYPGAERRRRARRRGDADRQRCPSAAQGIRPPREHGRHAARARRAGDGARRRPDRVRASGAHRRHGRPAA